MIVIWTPEAEQDRADIWDYIAADNPGAAGLTVSIASSNMGAVTVAPASRMYTGGGGGNFATPQAFTISAVTGMAGMTSMLTLSAPGQADKIVMVTVN